MTEGEAYDLTQDVNGLESWRRLHRRFDPSTGGRKRNLLRMVINPGRCKLDELQGRLSAWEVMVRRYEHMERAPLPDGLKLAGLEALVPAELENHLLLNANRISTYAEARVEVET